MVTLPEMPTYKEYKFSGVEWLGDIPVNWETKRVKFLFKIGRGRVISQQELEDDGRFPVYSSQTKNNGILGYISTYDFDCEQITWTTDGANAGTVFLRKGKHNCTNVCGTLQPYKPLSINLSFISKSLLIAAQFYKRPDTNGAKIMNNEMAEIFITFPPPHEQNAIADFLDKKIIKIDEATAIKEKQIALLLERKQIIIQKALIQGINNDAPMKDSGVEWIGKIPEHWEVIKLKYLFKEVNDRTDTGEETLLSLRMDLGLIPHDEVSDKQILDKDLIGYKRVCPGQMIMNRMRAAIGIFGIPRTHGLVSPDYAVFNVIQNINLEYFLLLFKTSLLGTQFRLNSKGLGTGSSGFMRLYSENFGDIKVPFCSETEQTEIFQFIETETNKINNSIELINDQINKLKEYKITLINGAVTGKIKVA